jgi:hypothetical protein
MNSDLRIAFEVTLKVIAIFVAIALFVPFIFGSVFWLVKHSVPYYHWVYSLFGAQNYFN